MMTRLQYSLPVCHVIAVLISIVPMRVIWAGSGVPVILNYKPDVTVAIGDELSIVCPIVGDNVMYQWRVGRIPDYQISNNPRFRLSQDRRTLELTNRVTREDEGDYKCKGVTGFGNRNVTFRVRILESKFCATPKTNDPKMKAPCFMESSINRKVTVIEREVGSSVELNCMATGTPPPKYMWFMGTTIADWIRNAEGVRGPVFSIRNLRREHTGRYTCRVSNEAGTVNYTYTLVIKDSPSPVPRILTRLTNRTEIYGQEATFVCKVQCDCTPIVQWLKRVEPHERKTYEARGKRLISLPKPRPSELGEDYATLEQTNMTRLERGLFLSRLTIGSVVDADAGKYVVMTMGRPSSLHDFDYQVAYVQVTKATYPPERSNLILYIAVPLCILIVCLGVIIYCCVSRRVSSFHYGRRPLPRHASSNGPSSGGTGGLLSLTSSGGTGNGTKIVYPSSQSPNSPASSMQQFMGPPGGQMPPYKYPPQGHYEQYTPMPPTQQPPMMNGGGVHMYYPTHHSSSSNGYSMHQYPT